jgi:hypothetical protein
MNADLKIWLSTSLDIDSSVLNIPAIGIQAISTQAFALL